MPTNDAFNLLPDEVIERFRTLGRQESDTALVVLKLFTVWTGWTWYATEAYWICADGREVNFAATRERPADAVDVHFFGLAVGFEAELGYFSLEELRWVRGPGGLRIERDLYLPAAFTLEDARAEHRRRSA